MLIVEISDTGIGIEPEVLPRDLRRLRAGRSWRHPAVWRARPRAGHRESDHRTARRDDHSRKSRKRSGLALSWSDCRWPTAQLRLRINRCCRPAATRSARRTPSRICCWSRITPTPPTSSRACCGARGYHVTVASSIAQAKAAAAVSQRTVDDGGRLRPVGLVISDLGLPDGSGHDLMRELRESYRLRGIALSGFGMDDDVQRARDAGFVRHLTKPVDFENLVGNIRELLAAE